MAKGNALQYTRQTTNFARLARIILGPCAEVLRAVLRKEISPPDLKTKFIKRLASKKNKFSQVEINAINNENYSDFDISLLYKLLRLLSSLPPPKNGWGNSPGQDDRSASANIERIREIKNRYYAHVLEPSLSSSKFGKITENIVQILKELETYNGISTNIQDDVEKLRLCSMDPEIEQKYIKTMSFDAETDTGIKSIFI